MNTRTCEYFALCTNPAVGITKHPILQSVPTCERCAALMEVALYTVENAGEELVIFRDGHELDRIDNQTDGEWDDFEILHAYFYSPYGVA